jgi:hypothetical protein
VYHINIVQSSGAASLTIDGEAHAGSAIPLVDDGRDHTVELRLGGEFRGTLTA